jgi:hypothetical protein
MDNRTLQAAYAEAKERSRLMLDPRVYREAVAAEKAYAHVPCDDGFAGMPKRQEPEPAPVRRTTDSEALRTEQWKAYVDDRIAATLEPLRAAIGVVVAQERQAHRAEIEKLNEAFDLRISAALQAVEKLERGIGGDRGAIIDLPAFVGKRDGSRS